MLTTRDHTRLLVSPRHRLDEHLVYRDVVSSELIQEDGLGRRTLIKRPRLSLSLSRRNILLSAVSRDRVRRTYASRVFNVAFVCDRGERAQRY